jgi:hypothetical protein
MSTDDKTEAPAPSPPAPSVRSGRRQALLQGFAILVSGIIIGAAGTMLLRHCWRHGGDKPRFDPDRMAARTQERLDLSDAETAKVKEVFVRHVERMRALRQEMHPKIKEEFERLKSEMQTALPADKYADWLKHLEERRSRHRGRRGHGFRRHGPPGK